VAVLGAAAGLQADDALDLDLRTAPLHPHLVREPEEFLQTVVTELEHLGQLLLIQADTLLEYLLSRDSE
jgi:hypothetical protein